MRVFDNRPKPPKPGHGWLSILEEEFVRRYLGILGATKGDAATALLESGWEGRHPDPSHWNAAAAANRILKKPSVRHYMEKRKEVELAKIGGGAQAVLERLFRALDADPNEISQYRRVCCRCCWGKGFKPQRTAGEYDSAHVAWLDWEMAEGEAKKPFDEKGGPGFDGTRDPNPECPECFGEGVGVAWFGDTRKLSPEATALYQGVEITRNGTKVNITNRHDLLVLAMRHYGLLTDKSEVTVTHDFRELSDAELVARTEGLAGGDPAAQGEGSGILPGVVPQLPAESMELD